MTLHFISEKHRRFHIKFLSCLLIQLPGGGGGGDPFSSNLERAYYWGGV